MVMGEAGVGADEGQSGKEGSSPELTLGLGMEQCEVVMHMSTLFQSLSPMQLLQSLEESSLSSVFYTGACAC